MQLLQQKHIEALSQCVTEARLATLVQALDNRTRYLAVVIEDVYQSQNVSAVLRTCECTGIQDVHIVESRNIYTVNPKVVMGADKWLTIHKYSAQRNVSAHALAHIKDLGYRVVVTSPHAQGLTLPQLDVRKGPIALVFGTELSGVSQVAMEMADEHLQIPMYGLTESFNLSVSAGISLYYIMEKIRLIPSLGWELPHEERASLLHHWLRQSVRSWKSIERRVAQEHGEIK